MSIKSADSKDAPLSCPFCLEQGYDKKGLKMHLELGFCEVWNAVKTK